MPFTFAHPAIILPLTRLPSRWFSLTGLIVGSMTPDFEYFLRMKVQSNYCHTVGGLFWFDIPLGILIAFVFHNIVRDDLFDHLPLILKSRLVRFKSFNWNLYFKNNWLVVIISLLIGAASHLFWDSFTHFHGYFVQHITALTTFVHFSGKEIPVWKMLQHLSTLLGAVVIIIALLKMPVDKNIVHHRNIKYWILFTVLTIFIIGTALLATGFNVNLLGNLVVTAISAAMISLILTPLILKSKTRTFYSK